MIVQFKKDYIDEEDEALWEDNEDESDSSEESEEEKPKKIK